MKMVRQQHPGINGEGQAQTHRIYRLTQGGPNLRGYQKGLSA
jgi:hypothetical protein